MILQSFMVLKMNDKNNQFKSQISNYDSWFTVIGF